jgi:hypothetical protein
MNLRLAALLAVALVSGAAEAAGTVFTYQGYLTVAGAPAQGAHDLRITLLDGGGVAFASPLLFEDHPVDGGRFTLELDFGPAFDGSDRALRIEVRDGASVGAFTAMVPDTPIHALPHAQHSDAANFAASVAGDSVGGDEIIDGSVRALDVDATQVQRRVAQTCAAGSAIRSIDATGTVSCEVDDQGSGDVTGVVTAAGSGLQGGQASGDSNLSIAPSGVDSSRIADGTVAAADVNAAQVQLRVAQGCSVGTTIQSISASGVPTCAPPTLDSYEVPIPFPYLSDQPVDNCQSNGILTATNDAASVTLPAGTYFALMPSTVNFNLSGGVINAVNVESSGFQEIYLRSPTGLLGISQTRYDGGTPEGNSSTEGLITDINSTVFTLQQATAVFVRVNIGLSGCGTVFSSSGKHVRVVRLR